MSFYTEAVAGEYIEEAAPSHSIIAGDPAKMSDGFWNAVKWMSAAMVIIQGIKLIREMHEKYRGPAEIEIPEG